MPEKHAKDRSKLLLANSITRCSFMEDVYSIK